MNETPNYHLPDVAGDLRARVLDLCIHRLWHDALELLHQNGIQHYDRADLLNFYNWAPAYLPEPPVKDPAPTFPPEPVTPTSTSAGSSGVPPQSTSDNSGHQLRDARQQLVNVLSARAQSPAITNGQLLTDLRDVINRYVVLPDMAAETLALWVVHTYAFTLRQVTTYIGVVSPEKRCGKTTLLELLGTLAHEPLAAANISPPALFRVIEEKQPTLIIDEADTFLHGRDEMAGILNAGYRKSNSYVVRVSEGKGRKDGLTKYSCWCPKVMAAIGRLPDTLADRCIVVTMQRKMPGEKCERLRELDATSYQQRCADFVATHSDAIASARPEIPSALNDRAADIWEPLLAIADLAGGEWPVLARRAAEKLSSNDEDMPLIGYFLFDLRNWMNIKKTDRMLTRDIVTAFNACHTRPWEDLRRGREINDYWLSRKMRELGIRSRNIRIGESVGKGYVLDEVEAALKRYVPDFEARTVKTAAEPAEDQVDDEETAAFKD